MQKAYMGPGQIKSFRNNYLALAIATALLPFITTVCLGQSVAPYDSTKNRQVQSSYGFDYGNITVGTLRIPRDTVKMAVKDSGAIAYKRGAVYVWSGRVWLLVSGTSVILNPAPGIDSIRFTQYTVCVYPHDEASQCYEWLSFPTNAHISDDSARYVFTNSRNDSIFSLPTKLVHAVGVNGITITRGGTGPDGLDTVYYTFTGSVSGGSGITKVGSPAYGLTRTNDSTYIADTAVLTSQTRTTAGLAQKLYISDTAAMLLPYRNKINQNTDSITAHNIRIGANTAAIALKQDLLISGTNIKTVNGNSLLGSGDLVISGGSSIDTSNFSHYNGIQKAKMSGTVHSFGNSITAGGDASTYDSSYIPIVGRTLGLSVVNYAVASFSVKNVIDTLFRVEPPINVPTPATLLIGINDIDNSTSTCKINKVEEGAKTFIVNRWLDFFAPADSSAFTKTGSFSNLSVSNLSSKSLRTGRGNPIKTSTAGDKITIPFQGDMFVAGMFGVDSSLSASYSSRAQFKVDGVIKLVYNPVGKADSWYYAPRGVYDERMPTVVVIPMSPGKHTIEIENLDNKELDIDYIGRLAPPANVKPIVLIHTLKAKVAGYVPAGSAANVDSVIGRLNSIQKYFNDNGGYPLYVAKTGNNVDTATMSPLHPNNLGHRQIAASVLGVIDTTTTTVSLSTLTLGTGLTGASYNGSTNVTTRVDTGKTTLQIVTGGGLKKSIDSLAATLGGGSSSISGLTAAAATNSIDNLNYRQRWFWSTLAGDTALAVNSNSTAAASNAQVGLSVNLYGANSNSTQTTKSLIIKNTHTGTSSTNVGLSVDVSGGTNNYALIVPNGNVGIGTSAPNSAYALDIVGSIRTATGGGVGYWVTNGNAIRGTGTGSGTNYYIDGNQNGAEGTISFRATTLNINATISGNQSWNTNGDINAGTAGGASSGGFGLKINNYLAIGQSTDSTRLRVNDNTKFDTIAVKAKSMYIYDGVGVLSSQRNAPSAMLELQSTTRGFLTPRMLPAQIAAISSPTKGLQVYDSTANSMNIHNGVNWEGLMVISAAGTLTIAHGNDYVFTGTTTTWTLPAVNAFIYGRQHCIKIKNRGSGAITLNSNAGSTLYNTTTQSTITIAAGAAVELMPDGTYFNVMYNL